MATIKTKEDIELLKEGGKRLAHILHTLCDMVAPGVMIKDIDDEAFKLINEAGDVPAFLHYQPEGADRPYPASTCISINDEIVHGIPNENNRELKEGDIVTIDLGLIHNNLITDTAYTVGVGRISDEAKLLLKATKEALQAGVDAAQGGNYIGDIGYAIEQVASRYGVGIFRELVGHGVGYAVHEDPYIPNYGKPGKGEKLKPGMVIAIEPMFSLGSEEIKLAQDGYTYITKDGSLSAHFEHTVAITEDVPIILTKE